MSDLNVLLIQHPTPRKTFNLPLGLGYLASALKSKGAAATIIDASAPYRSYHNKDIAKIVEKEHFDIVGITVTTLFTGFAYDLMQELSGRDALVVAGGPHVTLFPHEAFQFGAKISVKGEGERSICEIADHLLGKKRLADIPGISYINEDGKYFDTPDRQFIQNLDEISFPDRDAFIYRDYVRNENDLQRFGNILTSRGCPGRCSFCSKKVFGDTYRFRSPENIIAEIKLLNKNYGIKHFDFSDDAMTCNSKRVALLCELIEKEIDFNITWTCVTRIDFINTDILKKMRQAGCIHISYGIESANPETLKKIRKGISTERIENTLGKTHEAGIKSGFNFMWGYPWEDVHDIKNSLNFMKKISRFATGFNTAGILIPFPGTEIYETYKNEYGFQEWWLKRDKFTGPYRKRLKEPLFRHYFFNDQGMMENGGFFNYSKEVKREIKKAINFIGRFNLRKQPLVFYLFGLLFIKLSYLTYNISYKLEIRLQTIFFFLLRLKHAARKPD